MSDLDQTEELTEQAVIEHIGELYASGASLDDVINYLLEMEVKPSKNIIRGALMYKNVPASGGKLRSGRAASLASTLGHKITGVKPTKVQKVKYY